MADSDSRQQNLAFLQQMERQRLQKPYLRSIDLRGKVSGECQAYQIGTGKHYLDDRSYILLKTLLDRHDNKFTVGVYEAWQKALQLLVGQDNSLIESDPQPILYRDSEHIQMLAFDSRISRNEPRLNITTPVQIDAGELRYHASSLNISTSALRVSMRRAQTLQNGQQVLVSLPNLSSDNASTLLNDMPYRIQSLEHTTRNTIAVIQRQRGDDLAISDWFDNWLAEKQQLSVMDLDSELFNVAREYYLRLLCQYFSAPLFWCDTFADNVLFIHDSQASEKILSSLSTAGLLEKLPFAAVSSNGAILLSIDQTGFWHWASETDRQQVGQLLRQPTLSHLYYLQKQPVAFAAETIKLALAPLAERQPQTAETLAGNLLKCWQLFKVSDITAIGHNLIEDNDPRGDLRDIPPVIAKNLPVPQTLSLNIHRHAERYVIHTPIKLHYHQQSFSLTTSELSAQGFSVEMPIDCQLTPGSRITVEFTRWQQKTKLNLTAIPFEVRRQHSWQGVNYVGLKRLIEYCSPAVNQFFHAVLAENKPTLEIRTDDLQINLTSRLFASQLSANLSDVLLFFALDKANNRILQAVAATQSNAADDYKKLWESLAKQVGKFTQPLKLPISDLQTSISFGVYAFRNNNAVDWQINCDLWFTQNTDKTLFIRRAMAASEQRFYNCVLQAIKPGFWADATDLQQQLSQLRHHNSHKVKQIRETLNSLFALAQLTDVTDIIASQYR